MLRRMTVKGIDDDGTITGYDKESETAVPPDKFPLIYSALKLPVPGILIGRDPNAQVDYEIWAGYNVDEFKALGLKDKEGIRIAPVAEVEFTRLLAKIAHAYAVAELGFDAFEHALSLYIRNRPMKALEWIGGDIEIPPPRAGLHDIRWRIQRAGDSHYVVVDLRLFSFVGSPQYHVVVGALKRPLDQFPFLEQPLHTIDVKGALPLGEFVPILGDIGGTGS